MTVPVVKFLNNQMQKSTEIYGTCSSNLNCYDTCTAVPVFSFTNCQRLFGTGQGHPW